MKKWDSTVICSVFCAHTKNSAQLQSIFSVLLKINLEKQFNPGQTVDRFCAPVVSLEDKYAQIFQPSDPKKDEKSPPRWGGATERTVRRKAEGGLLIDLANLTQTQWLKPIANPTPESTSRSGREAEIDRTELACTKYLFWKFFSFVRQAYWTKNKVTMSNPSQKWPNLKQKQKRISLKKHDPT